MKVLIIGAAGMVGAKLAARLTNDGAVGDKPIEALTLVDIVQPAAPQASGIRIATEAVDLSECLNLSMEMKKPLTCCVVLRGGLVR